MTKLNKVITEEIARLPVTLSFDYATKLYSVVDEKNKELYKADKWKMTTWLVENDARMFSPRYVANFPLSDVNRNEGDITHFSPEALLELLRIRNGAEDIKITICPRAVVKGANKIIDIEQKYLGEECLVKDIKEASLLNFLEVADDEDIKKLVIRKTDENEPQIALILGTNKYYPVIDNDEEGFGESLCNVLKLQGCEFNKQEVLEALKTPGLHIFEAEVEPAKKIESIIKEQEVVFESRNINQLSKTYIRMNANSQAEGWKVTPIKESGDYFSFDVRGNFKNKNLRDDNYIGNFLVEGVRFIRGSLLNESNDISKATMAMNGGLTITEAMDALLGSGSFEKKSITESKEEEIEPYKPLFRITQIVNDKTYKISEWRAVDAKTAREEFIAENPDYVNKKLEVELVECADGAGTTTADMSAVTKDSKVLFPMKKKEITKESVSSELDSLVESYGYDADGANFVYEPQSTIDEDEIPSGFNIEVAKELQQMLLDDDGTLAYIDGTEEGEDMLRDAVADYLQAMALPNDLDSVQEYSNWLKDNTKLTSDEAIVDPQYNGANTAIAEDDKPIEYYNKKYGTLFGARTKELVDNGMDELEAARKAVAEYSGLEESSDSTKKVQSICNDLFNKKITKDEARELIKAADEDLQDYMIDMMVDKPASFIPVEESKESSGSLMMDAPEEVFNSTKDKWKDIISSVSNTVHNYEHTIELRGYKNTLRDIEKKLKELGFRTLKRDVEESSEKKEGLLGLVGGALVGAATTGSVSGAIGSALLTSRIEDQRKASEQAKADEEARKANAQWDQLFAQQHEEVMQEAPEDNDIDGTNIPEPNSNTPAAADDTNANEPPADTNIDIDIDNNDGSIDDLLGDTNIADIDPPVDDQYSVDAGGDSVEISKPQDKNGKVIGLDNDDLIVQWEDGTTSTEKVNNVELS